jgi:hypothetical protein
MLYEGGFTFTNFLIDVFAVFMFFVWFWLLIRVFSDLFRRSDISGWTKVLWVILLIGVPYLGIFAYILTQGQGMSERDEARVEQTRSNLRRAAGLSVADEIDKLGRLKAQGAISEQEYARLRARLVE